MDAETHDILKQLINDVKVSSAWLGGKVGPLYFNWMDRDNLHKGIFYQGCYSVTTPGTCFNTSYSPVNCQKTCRTRSYPYFGLHYPSTENRLVCCCRTHFGLEGHANPEGCSPCHDDQDVQCGNNPSYEAVYMSRVQRPSATMWETGYPKGLTYYNKAACLAVKGSRELGYTTTSLVHRRCWEFLYPLCVSKTGIGGSCWSWTQLPKTKICLKKLNNPVPWESAKSKCFKESEGYSSRLISFVDYSSFKDLHGAMNKLLKNRTSYFWIFGSSRRWIWQDGTSNIRDVKTNNWSSKEERFVRDDYCIMMDEDGKWKGLNCNSSTQAYVCEFDQMKSSGHMSTTYMMDTTDVAGESPLGPTDGPAETTIEQRDAESRASRSKEGPTHVPTETNDAPAQTTGETSTTNSLENDVSSQITNSPSHNPTELFSEVKINTAFDPTTDPASVVMATTGAVAVTLGLVAVAVITVAAIMMYICWKKRRAKENVEKHDNIGITMQSLDPAVNPNGMITNRGEPIIYENTQQMTPIGTVQMEEDRSDTTNIASEINGNSSSNSREGQSGKVIQGACDDVLYAAPNKGKSSTHEGNSRPTEACNLGIYMDANPVDLDPLDKDTSEMNPGEEPNENRPLPGPNGDEYAVISKDANNANAAMVKMSVNASASSGVGKNGIGDDNSEYYNFPGSKCESAHNTRNFNIPTKNGKPDELLTVMIDNDIYNT